MRYVSPSTSTAVFLFARIFFCLVITVSMAACANVRSKSHIGAVQSSEQLTEDSVGVSYFLPKKRLELTVSREPIAPAALRLLLADAKTKKQNKATQKKQADERVSAARKVLASIRADTPEDSAKAAREEYAAAVKAAKKKKNDLKAASDRVKDLEAAQKQLDRLGGAIVDGQVLCPIPLYKLNLKILEAEADKKFLFRANLKHWWLRDDEVSISVNEKGLLSSAEITTTDQTGEILAQIAKTIAFFGSPTPNSVFAAANTGTRVSSPNQCKARPDLTAFKEELIFDPTDAVAVEHINNVLENNLTPYCVRIDGFVYASATGQCKNVTGISDGNDNPVVFSSASRDTLLSGQTGIFPWTKATAKGLVYRPSIPHKVEIVERLNDAPQIGVLKSRVVDAAIFFMPNKGPVSLAPTTAGMLVTTKYGLKFKDGVLVSWETDRPSEVLQIVRLPLSIVDGVFESLSKLIPFRTEQLVDQTELLEANLKLIEARQALSQAQAVEDEEISDDNN